MSEHLWTAFEAAAATGGVLCARGGDPGRWVAEEWSARGVSIDTRTLRPGELFVALKDARDGHDFLKSAFDAGAAAALVDRAPEDAPDAAPLVLVNDTLAGLRDLARAARDRNFGKRIAVTGSVGKTSTKEMLRAALASCGQVHAADKSFNNHWGVPLTLAGLPMRAEYGVFEIGMNHAGEIAPLTALVAPHVALVTTVAPAHLEHFESVAGIAEEKASIYSGLTPGGVAVVPFDNEHAPLLTKRAGAAAERIVTFGATEGADYRLVDARPDGEKTTVRAEIDGRPFAFQIGAAGRHQAMNALAALAVCVSAGAALEPCAAGLLRFAAGAGRGLMREIAIGDGAVSVLDESYNANPASMAAAIALLGARTPRGAGRRLAVIGDMLELGPDAPAFHAALAADLEAAGVARVYLSGPLTAHLWDALPASMKGAHGAEVGEIASILLDDLQDGDTILVKGSNASKVSAVIGVLETARKTG